MQMQTKTQQIEQLRADLTNLRDSPLYSYRMMNTYQVVVGEGDYNSELVFIGEAPGKNEAEQGRPFCGASGRVLDAMIESIGKTRKDVYITNIVNDRPPDNRDPSPAEIQLYSTYLERHLEILKPTIVATLGRFSMKFMFETYAKLESIPTISTIHGHVYKIKTPWNREVSFVPMYHPASTLYNPKLKIVMQEDFHKLKGLLDII